jgi:hypothetical protein
MQAANTTQQYQSRPIWKFSIYKCAQKEMQIKYVQVQKGLTPFMILAVKQNELPCALKKRCRGKANQSG